MFGYPYGQVGWIDVSPNVIVIPTPPSDACLYELEDGSGTYELEDGSGSYQMESCSEEDFISMNSGDAITLNDGDNVIMN